MARSAATKGHAEGHSPRRILLVPAGLRHARGDCLAVSGSSPRPNEEVRCLDMTEQSSEVLMDKRCECNGSGR